MNLCSRVPSCICGSDISRITLPQNHRFWVFPLTYLQPSYCVPCPCSIPLHQLSGVLFALSHLSVSFPAMFLAPFLSTVSFCFIFFSFVISLIPLFLRWYVFSQSPETASLLQGPSPTLKFSVLLYLVLCLYLIHIHSHSFSLLSL